MSRRTKKQERARDGVFRAVVLIRNAYRELRETYTHLELGTGNIPFVAGCAAELRCTSEQLTDRFGLPSWKDDDAKA